MPAGAPVQTRGGERSYPSQVKRRGINAPSANAPEVICIIGLRQNLVEMATLVRVRAIVNLLSPAASKISD